MEQLECLKNLTPEIVQGITNRYHLNTILIFGSAVGSEFHEESDIDFAVLGETPLTLKDKLALELYLEDIIQREIDIIDLKDTSLDIFVKIQALNDGISIYSTDNNQLLEQCIDETEHYYRINESFYSMRRRDLLS